MNNFTFTGNLGRDCRLGSAGGTAVVNFAVAVKSGFGQNEQTLWVDCALWGKQAESRLPEFLVKGQQVAVAGELGTREHEGKTYLTCRVSQISLVGGKSDNQGGQQQAPQQNSQQGQQQWQQNNNQTQQQAPQQQQSKPQAAQGYQEPPMDFDDDIPFAPIGLQYRNLPLVM